MGQEGNKEKKYYSSGECRLIRDNFKPKKMREEIEVLGNGLPVAIANIINPHDGEIISIKALIDTGSDACLMNKEKFEKFNNINKEWLGNGEMSPTAEKIIEVDTYPLAFKLPKKNYRINGENRFAIKEFHQDREYDVILGVNALKDITFIYSGTTNQAWIEY